MELLLGLVHNIGALSFATLVLFLFAVNSSWTVESRPGRVFQGLLLGLVVVFVSQIPVRLAEGAIFDLRAGPLVVSALFGGPLSAAFTILPAAIARISIGGPAVIPGTVSVFIYAGAGLLARRYARQRDMARFGVFGFVLLGLFATGLAVFGFFVGVDASFGLLILIRIWPMLVVGNVIGVTALGLLMEQTERIRVERDRFREASIAAQEGIAAKNRFLTAVSHDIRTPLNGMLGALQMLRRRQRSAEDDELIQVALSSGTYLSELVNQILDFARLESGGLRLDARTFTVSQLADTVRSIFAGMARDKQLELAVEVSDCAERSVSGPYDQLRQILFNLVGNAIRYTERGRVAVRFVCEIQGEDRLTLNCSVADTGPGVPEADRERIFETFVRLDERGSDRSGTGLGLSIARGLVRGMGGDLNIESTVGIGSTFHFSVDLGLRAPPAEGEATQHEGDGPAPLAGRHVLVVDDNEVNRRLITSWIHSFGASTAEANSGEAALAVVRSPGASFDVILMDIQMPDLNGDEVTRRIRDELPHMSGVPILGVTANAFPEQREAYLAAGMNAVVVKPIDFAQLADVIGMNMAPHADNSGPVPRAHVPRREQGEPGIVDPTRIAEISRSMDAAEVQEILRESIETLTERLDAMRSPQAPPSPKRLQRLAHDSKGLAAYLGFTRVSEVTLEMLRGSWRDEEIASAVAIVAAGTEETQDEAGRLAGLMRSLEDAIDVTRQHI